MTERPSWDDYFLGIADAVAARGECVRSQVGAVLVRDNRIVATGYNGVEAGEPSCLDGICPRAQVQERNLPYDEDGPGRCIAFHAEDNAITDAYRRGLSVSFSHCSIYVTREPCERCAGMLRMIGVRAVWRGQTVP